MQHALLQQPSLQFQGITRLLFIRVPFFREILLESFSCDHCDFKNTSVKSAGEIQEKGSKITFRIENENDFQRQIVRADSGIFKIDSLDLEAPAGAGQLTNLESMMQKILVDLQSDQAQRKLDNPELHDAIQKVLDKLVKMLNCVSFPITVSVDDPSGNSFIEPSPNDKNDKYTRTDYLRTHEQNLALGLAVDEEDEAVPALDPEVAGMVDAMQGVDIVDGQIYEIPADCPACSKDCTVNMKQVKIPHFKEVIIMATVCDNCGYRTNDVKTGGAIPEQGERITLKVERPEDLSRDILKSETAALKSPELELEVQPGTLGGRFTTVEGLLRQVKDQLYGQIFDVGEDDSGLVALTSGDSMPLSIKQKWDRFFDRLDKALLGEISFTITLEDPLASSFIAGIDGGSIEDDKLIIKEHYDRTEEEIEDLGLNDIKTEGYELDEIAEEAAPA